MKNYFHFICAFFLVSILIVSCKKDIPSPIDNTTPTTFSQVFDDYWNQMNVNYVYWDIDTTNWDNVYQIYKPIFAQLNIHDNNDVQKSVVYFKQITDGLIDSHYYLSITIPPVADTIDPAIDRKLMSSNFHKPYGFEKIDTTVYMDKGFIAGTYTNSANEKINALSGTINNKILYFHCSQFALLEAYQSATNNGVKTVLQYFFDQLQNLPSTIHGLIIDVRDNPGGEVPDLNFLVGNLINEQLHFGYSRYKSGNGRLSYTPWIDADILPQHGSKALNIPVIVLADNFSASLAEATTMAIHTLPNGIFVGETTWGATGPIAENSLYDDGQFTVGNLLSVYTSSAEFKYIDGQIYEGRGFPPDVSVPFNLTAWVNNDDLQLDKAISLIN